MKQKMHKVAIVDFAKGRQIKINVLIGLQPSIFADSINSLGTVMKNCRIIANSEAYRPLLRS